MSRRSALWGIAALLASAVAVAGCGKTGGGAGGGEVIKIGVSAPLTGNIAAIGQSTKNAVLMAEAEINEKGGIDIGGKKMKVQFVIEDDENKPESTANVFQKLINQDKVIAIIGSQSSSATNAGAPIANDAKVPAITPWATNPNVTKGKKYVFRAAFIDPFQGYVNAKFAYENLKARKAAVLYDVAQDYNKGLAEVFRDEFKKMGGEITAFETYTTGDKDFSAQLTKIKGTNPDVIFLPNYYSEVPLQIQQARKLGINAIFLGGDAWDSPKLLEIGGKDMEGTYFSNHYVATADVPKVKEFVTKYKQKYNEVPDAAAALTYDAAYIIFQALERAGSLDRDKLRDAMAATKGFEGVTGTISYGDTGDPVKPAVVLKIENGEFKYETTVNP
ncbi:ABC transporter substrate-binding protein [Caldinitratiruptor microaerophilus]|uniref:Branched-chain amino acid ABC transporter substrate-binding protein n=1 Tax=Caldinitratiruptor microaerophilus TaxID=671077 RepID=A0AA35CPF9_9FIRM|nr:ABC transporter substrate-binding protein [Caldinitratiruptor microaerophilus]BDG62413.1 branched-chain amino acid ABC transporter substrate-binding protein [Caldinitratiruptor microaerophilus]